MKSFLIKFSITAFACVTTHASVTINAEFGQLRDSSGTILANQSTLYVVIYDEDNNSELPGGLGLNGSLVQANALSAHTAFSGVTFSVGQVIGGDRVVKIGTFNDEDGYTNPILNSQDFISSGITETAARAYAFYWFPGLDSTSSVVPTSSFQVGGINEKELNTGTGSNFIGMEIPSDGAIVSTSILDTDLGGDIADTSRFTAITAVPEPSALVLTLFGSMALLRRRRA